jgi:hypothetical protein
VVLDSPKQQPKLAQSICKAEKGSGERPLCLIEPFEKYLYFVRHCCGCWGYGKFVRLDFHDGRQTSNKIINTLYSTLYSIPEGEQIFCFVLFFKH